MTINLPQGLEDIIVYAWPDALWVAAEVRNDDTYTLWVLNLDNTYTEWTACLSVDERWTLSPVRGPWHTYETGSDEGNAKWRGIRSQHAKKFHSIQT